MSYDLTARADKNYSQWVELERARKVVASVVGVENSCANFLHVDRQWVQFQVDFEAVSPEGDLLGTKDERINAIRFHLQTPWSWRTRFLLVDLAQTLFAEFGWTVYDEQLGLAILDDDHFWRIETLPGATRAEEVDLFETSILVSGKGFVHLWDRESWRLQEEQRDPESVFAARFDKIGRVWVLSGKALSPFTTLIVDAFGERRRLEVPECDGFSVVDENRVLLRHHTRGVWLLDVHTGELSAFEGVSGQSLAVAPDAKSWASPEGLREMETGEVYYAMPKDHQVWAMAFSSERCLVTGGREKRILVHDLAAPGPRLEIKRCGEIRTLAAGKNLLFSGAFASQHVSIWELTTGKRRGQLKAPGSPKVFKDGVLDAGAPESGRKPETMATDESLAIVAYNDGRIVVWDVEDRCVLRTLGVGPQGEWVLLDDTGCIASSSDDFTALAFRWVTDAQTGCEVVRRV